MSARRTRPLHPVLAGGPLLIAHRGGAGLAPENTMAAFRNAAERWHADMIELDVHASADGRCVVIHDDTVDRTTDGSGAVASMTAAELQQLDAGYHFTTDGGRTFPFRGRGVGIAILDDVLSALPDMRFTIEVKTRGAQQPLFDAIDAFSAGDRVVAAGMHDADRDEFDRHTGPISASTEQMRSFLRLHALRLDFLTRLRADVAQVPERAEGHRIVTPRFVRALHKRGILVHVWTVNEEADMRQLLSWGVDGLVTDRPDRLARVLHDLGHPHHAGQTTADARKR